MFAARITELFGLNDKVFYRKLITLSIPVIIQQSMASMLFFVDNIMVSSLGESEIAAVGLANQLTFLYNMFLIGITSGGGIFVAQMYGAKQTEGIGGIQGIMLRFSLSVALIAAAVGTFLPAHFVGLFIKDAAVVALGGPYLRIVCAGYIAQAITFSYSSVLRNCGRPALPTSASGAALLTNIVLNYCLIFGKFGFPKMGVRGAATATVIAAFTEAVIVCVFSYLYKLQAGASLSRLLARHKGLFRKYLRTSAPVILNELGWSGGMLAYTFFYGMMGKQTVAAMQIHSAMDRASFFLFISVAIACGIMCGNAIGAGESRLARIYAKRFMAIMAVCAIVIGALVALLGPKILAFYNIATETKFITQRLIVLYGSFIWCHALVFVLIVGVLRSGGDTLFATCTELLPMYLVGIPLFYVLAIVLHWPVYLAYLGQLFSDFIKLAIALARFRGGNWIKSVIPIKKSAG